MRYVLFFFSLLSCWVLEGKEFCFFRPPEGWMPAAPDTLSPSVKVGFIDPKNFGFRASLNLAEEAIDCTLDEYLDAVKAIHSADRHNQWIYLGKFPTKAGQAALTQIDTNSSWGPLRMLQLILVHNNKAYILTAAASKKDFPNLVKTFRQSLNSLSITENLFSAVPSEEKRQHLLKLKTTSLLSKKTEDWENFENEVLHNFKDLGTHWQALLLAEAITERKSDASH